MLIRFTVGNFRSIKDPVTLSMEAVGIHEFDDSNVIDVPSEKTRLLKSSSIYGANASGKSNIIKALAFMVNYVRNSAKEIQSGEKTVTEPFLLDKQSPTEPSFFEVAFIYNGEKYRYGFTLTQDSVSAEWLYFTAAKEFPLFIREENTLIKISPQLTEGNVWEKMTKKTEVELRSNALFVSTLGQLFGSAKDKESHSSKVINWFNKIQFINGLNDERIMDFTLSSIRLQKYVTRINSLINSADLGINQIIVDFNERNSSAKDKTAAKTMTEHLLPDGKEKVLFDMLSQESEGTKKIFALSAILCEVLEKGDILLFDEFDARLHPLLSWKLVELFHESNTKHAQLILATHDTNLLPPKLFRRDQIWFTGKGSNGATRLYSLVEFKTTAGGVRLGASYEKNYLAGQYGAIPLLKNFNLGHQE